MLPLVAVILLMKVLAGLYVQAYVVSYCKLGVTGLRVFLENQLVPEAGLLRAAVTSYPDNVTIWVTSDNLLAAAALRTLGSSLAEVVEKSLSKYGVNGDFLHEVLLLRPIPRTPRTPTVKLLDYVYSHRFNTTFYILAEFRNGSIIEDWQGYADLVVYESLNALLHGDVENAERLFSKVMTMFDGYGFRDRACTSRYETYKLALAVYAWRALAIVDPAYAAKHLDKVTSICEILSQLQTPSGGVVTHYIVENGTVIPAGDVNTETTSIVVLAVHSNYPVLLGLESLLLTATSPYHVLKS